MNNSQVLKFIPNPRLVGYGLLLIPISFLLLFTFGEILSGEPNGYLHILQIIPLLFFAILARSKMRVAGLCLMTLSVILGIFYAIAMGDLSLGLKVVVEAVLFLPPFLAGLLFFLV